MNPDLNEDDLSKITFENKTLIVLQLVDVTATITVGVSSTTILLKIQAAP